MSLILCVFAILSFALVYLNKGLLAPLIIASAIIGCGPGVDGRFVYDEVMIGAAVFATILVDWRNLKSNLIAVTRSFYAPDYMFLFFIFYLQAQTLRTFLNTGYVGVWYHSVHAIFVLIVYLLLKQEQALGVFSRPIQFIKTKSVTKISWPAFIAAIVITLNFAYMMQGVTLELVAVFGEATLDPLLKYSTQGSSWSGSVYAVLPNLLFLLIYQQLSVANPKVTILWLISVASVAVYYDSRVALAIFLISFVLLVLTKIKGFKLVLKIAVIALVFGISAVSLNEGLRRTAVTSVSGFGFLLSPRIEETAKTGDYDRYAHFYGAIRAVDESVAIAIFGHGTRMHRILLGKNVAEVLIDLGLKDFISEQTLDGAVSTRFEIERQLSGGKRTTYFSSLLIDYGILGVLLIFFAIPATIFSAQSISSFWVNQKLQAFSVVTWGVATLFVSTVSFMAENTMYWLFLMSFLIREFIAFGRHQD